MNDSPVDCQNHGVTEPQREGTALAVEGYKNVDNYYIFSIFLSQKESLSHLTVTAPFRQGSLIFTQSNSATNYNLAVNVLYHNDNETTVSFQKVLHRFLQKAVGDWGNAP